MMEMYLLFYEFSVAVHGEIHESNRTVTDECISVLTVQVGLTAHCEDDACTLNKAHQASGGAPLKDISPLVPTARLSEEKLLRYAGESQLYKLSHRAATETEGVL